MEVLLAKAILLFAGWVALCFMFVAACQREEEITGALIVATVLYFLGWATFCAMKVLNV